MTSGDFISKLIFKTTRINRKYNTNFKANDIMTKSERYFLYLKIKQELILEGLDYSDFQKLCEETF